MTLFKSLTSRGGLVRTPDGRHGAIESFDRRYNMAAVRFGGMDHGRFHFTTLRAGDEITEQACTGQVTKEFPKWSSWRHDGQARNLLTTRLLG